MSPAGETHRSIPDLPQQYLERMQRLLGDEFGAFVSSYTQSPQIGLRVNLLKISPTQFRELYPYKLDPIPWSPSGFRLLDLDQGQITPGKHPYHAAGLYYLQEPSAMLVAELLDPKPGEKILDLCAAPGGKTTQLASLMQNRGLLVANEIHSKRVWDLAENLERWGARNTVITNEQPERLAIHFGAYFDRVLVDAPCSGEGLFRRDPGARASWNIKLIEGCSIRQTNILQIAGSLVRPGGLLVYSTCTFAPEENEGSLQRFLELQPGFKIIDLPNVPGSDPGHPDWLSEQGSGSLKSAIRMWPHHIQGEGHFVAILQKTDGANTQYAPSQIKRKIPKVALDQFKTFVNDNLITFTDTDNLSLVGSYLYESAEEWPDFGSIRVIHPGWWLGTFKKNRFEPAHAFAQGLNRAQIQNYIDFRCDDKELINYLHGENLPARNAPSGWVVIMIDGFPIGWGKSIQGVIKNAYPRGLRRF